MNKSDWFLVGCFIAGGLFLFSGLVIAALYGSYSDYDGAPTGFQQGASVVLLLVGISFWVIGYLTLMLLPNHYTEKTTKNDEEKENLK